MSYLRAGLLGCGDGAEEIAARCLLHGHLDLVALCDPDPAAVRSLAERTGIDRTFLRPQDLLESGVDFVVAHMSTPGRDAAIEMAVNDGVHCLVQAPLAEDIALAEELVLAAAANEARLGVWLRGLEDPALLELRGRWEVEAFGEPEGATVWADPGAGPAGWDLAGPLTLLSWLTARPVIEVEPGARRAVLRGGLAVELEPNGGPRVEITGSDGRERWQAEPQDLAGDETRVRACDPIGRFAAWLDDGDDFPITGDEALEHVRVLAALRRALA